MSQSIYAMKGVTYGVPANARAGKRALPMTLLLRDVSFEIRASEFVCVLGPNGAGKSTLLDLLSGLAFPTSGDVLLNDRALGSYSRLELAKQIAVVRQEDRVVPRFSVREVVAMGRSPFLEGWMRLGPNDEALVDRALKRLGLTHFANRTTESLSGGELRLVSFARALAQAPKILLLDEPTAYLDLARERHLLSLAADLAKEETTVVAVVHDLHLDLSRVSRVICLREGKLLASGTPDEVLSVPLLSELFGTRVVRLPRELGLRFALE